MEKTEHITTFKLNKDKLTLWGSSLLHCAACLCLFLFLRPYYGYIFLFSLAVQQFISDMLSNLSQNRKKGVLFWLLSLLSCGFYFRSSRLFYEERKNKLSSSTGKILILGLYALFIFGLFDAWAILNLPYLIFALIADAVCALIILLSKHDPAYKSTCIFFIVLLFGFGYLIYILYVASAPFITYKKRCSAFDMRRGIVKTGDGRETCRAVEYLQTQGFAKRDCKDICYFPSGAAFFADLKQKLADANQYICFEFFIYDEGNLFEELFAILKAKAADGVKVYVTYDELGSCGCFTDERIKNLQACGINFCAFNSFSPTFNLNFNYRTHRKIVIIDGKIAYTGGINVADEYADYVNVCGRWKDGAVRLIGGVQNFLYLFEKQWFAVTGRYLENPCYDCENAGSFAVVFGDGIDYGNQVSEQLFLKMIRGASEQIDAMTPYYMPGNAIINALTDAAQRGVKVNLYLPETPDKYYVHRVSRLNAEQSAKKGVNVRYIRSGFVHSKILLCDDLALVGTANMDFRSLKMQDECGVLSDDKKLVDQIRADFADLEKNSTPLCDKNSLYRSPIFLASARACRLICYLF